MSVRSRLGEAYRRIAGPFGRRAVARILRDGTVPPAFGPALFAVVDPLDAVIADAIVARVEARREALAASGAQFAYGLVDTPHGPTRWLIAGATGPTVTARWLARSASIPARWGRVLLRCADAVPRGTVLELGALLGLSGAYLAHGRGCAELVAIEGSPVSAELAADTFTALALRARVLRSTFDEGLDLLLGTAAAPVGLAYLDGHHDGAATRHYVARLTPAIVPGGVLALDDITQNAGMWDAWQACCRAPGWSAAIHTGRVGLLVRDPAAAAPRVADLSRYSGWWRVGRRPDTTLPPDATR